MVAAAGAEESSNGTAVLLEGGPKPSVKIDNQTDPFSTIVIIQYGDLLGELLDTVRPKPHICSSVPCPKAPQLLDLSAMYDFVIIRHPMFFAHHLLDLL